MVAEYMARADAAAPLQGGELPASRASCRGQGPSPATALASSMIVDDEDMSC